jgi:hypothetical protein
MLIGAVASRLTVTDCELLPPALVAEQVKMAPAVSLVTELLPHPVCDVIVDWASVTVQLTDTLLVYQPFVPSVPLTVGVITGGVVSAATVV